MCNFLAGVSLGPGHGSAEEIICEPEHTDDHSLLLASRNVRDTNVTFMREYVVRWEFNPPESNADILNFLQWTFRVDERPIPIWFDMQATREKAETIISRMIVRKPNKTLLGGCWILTVPTTVIRGRVIGALRGSNLSGSNLSESNLSESNLSRSNLRGSNLRGSNLSGSNLRGSNLSESNLSESDLSESNLSRSNLSESDLSRSNLSRSNLSESDLSRSDLSRSNLSGSDLSGSDLSGSNLSESNLRGSNLSESNLSRSNLSESDLSESDLSELVAFNVARCTAMLPAGWVYASGVLRRAQQQ